MPHVATETIPTLFLICGRWHIVILKSGSIVAAPDVQHMDCIYSIAGHLEGTWRLATTGNVKTWGNCSDCSDSHCYVIAIWPWDAVIRLRGPMPWHACSSCCLHHASPFITSGQLDFSKLASAYLQGITTATSWRPSKQASHEKE